MTAGLLTHAVTGPRPSLKPFGYGKEVLRGRDKIYLADAALPGTVTLEGRKLLERPDRLGSALETAFFKHVYTRFYGETPPFSYWKGPKGEEADLIAEAPDRAVPFEVKYQDADISAKKLVGLRLFIEKPTSCDPLRQVLCIGVMEHARRDWLRRPAAGLFGMSQASSHAVIASREQIRREGALSASLRWGGCLMGCRKIAVAIPALNEAERIVSCLTALQNQRATPTSRLYITVLANNCVDETAAIVRARFSRLRIDVREVSLLPAHSHAGWARRLSLEAAAGMLDSARDLLLSTDADSIVASDWIARNLLHLDSGYDAVAGLAMPLIQEWRSLRPAHRARFNQLRKYQTLLTFLRRQHRGAADDPWPRHDYEGGSSIAMTLAAYRRLGEVPAPPHGEDKALFTAIETGGGRIRHPRDVRVFTSYRYRGRASGGMADTIAEWGRQGDDAAIHGAWPLNVNLGMFRTLEASRLLSEHWTGRLPRHNSSCAQNEAGSSSTCPPERRQTSSL